MVNNRTVDSTHLNETGKKAGIDASDTRIYDIFRMEDGSLVKVAWKDDSNRDTPIQKNDDGLFVNAAPLPEGQPAGSAKLAGSVKASETFCKSKLADTRIARDDL